jgi:hypothetical protein
MFREFANKGMDEEITIISAESHINIYEWPITIITEILAKLNL